jgi:hypothetical protein
MACQVIELRSLREEKKGLHSHAISTTTYERNDPWRHISTRNLIETQGGLLSERTNYPKYPVAHWANRNESEHAGSECETREPE